MILNNGSEKESNLCWSFLMQSFSAIHPSTTTEINRKSVGQGDQEWYLPENVTKEVFSKEIFGRAGIPIWLHVFQSSIFLHNHHPLNIQNVLCWFSHHFWPHLSQLKYFLLANTRDVQDICHILKPHWNPTLEDVDLLSYHLHRESEMSQSQMKRLNSWASVFPTCKADFPI